MEKLESSKRRKPETKKLLERGSRFGRDFNLAVGGIALVGAVVAPPLVAVGLGVYAGINFAQAGVFEATRRYSKNKNQKKSKSTK